MTHIANCMRQALDETGDVYIMEETLTSSPSKTGDAQKQSIEGLSRSSSIKYDLWPRPPKSQAVQAPQSNPQPNSLPNPSFVSERTMALSVGRSPTALSDTSVNAPKASLWRRGGSLSNRRKISVPELGATPKGVLDASFAMDSPTIPGRPPLRTVASASRHHERSNSAPSWRDNAFGDAMIRGVTEPKVEVLANPRPSAIPEDVPPAKFNTTRPLSPILSPIGNVTPLTAVPLLPKPVVSPLEIPPKVPPKSPPRDRTISPSKTNGKSNQSKWILKRSPSKSALHGLEQPIVRSTSPRSTSNSPQSRSVERNVKSPPPPPKAETPTDGSESVVNRGRPVKRPKRSRDLGSGEEPGGWRLPSGLKPADALTALPEVEKDMLKKQAIGQAERFEILGTKHVDSLSKELRALDERCDYLRETYRSLRAGRQRLQQRMISYLRNEAIPFSKENLIKQEEALVELDESIDDWIVKLELAENRRLRVRQKLLEHVAAAMTLNEAAPAITACTTPPGSPRLEKIQLPEPLRTERKGVESIKVYADNQVLNLFSDIEQAVTQMCEAY